MGTQLSSVTSGTAVPVACWVYRSRWPKGGASPSSQVPSPCVLSNHAYDHPKQERRARGGATTGSPEAVQVSSDPAPTCRPLAKLGTTSSRPGGTGEVNPGVARSRAGLGWDGGHSGSASRSPSFSVPPAAGHVCACVYMYL